eukprot:5881957-Prymnesium_polylepis.1
MKRRLPASPHTSRKSAACSNFCSELCCAHTSSEELRPSLDATVGMQLCSSELPAPRAVVARREHQHNDQCETLRDSRGALPGCQRSAFGNLSCGQARAAAPVDPSAPSLRGTRGKCAPLSGRPPGLRACPSCRPLLDGWVTNEAGGCRPAGPPVDPLRWHPRPQEDSQHVAHDGIVGRSLGSRRIGGGTWRRRAEAAGHSIAG